MHRSSGVKLRKFNIQQAQRLSTCSQLASQGILGSAKPRTHKMVTWRLKLVNTLHLGMMSKDPPPPGTPPNLPFWSCWALHSPGETHSPISGVILPSCDFWALRSLGSPGMPIEWIYRDCVPVEASATSLLSTGAALPNDFPRPPPPNPLHLPIWSCWALQSPDEAQ